MHAVGYTIRKISLKTQTSAHVEVVMPPATQQWLSETYGGKSTALSQAATSRIMALLHDPELMMAVMQGDVEGGGDERL